MAQTAPPPPAAPATPAATAPDAPAAPAAPETTKPAIDDEPAAAAADRIDLGDILAQLEEDPDDPIAMAPEVGTELTDARDLDRPKAAEVIVTSDGGLDFDPSFAPFGKRFLAVLIDAAILSLAMLPGLLLIVISGAAVLVALGVLLCIVAFFFVARAYAQSVSTTRQWFGNRIAGTYVVDSVNGANLDMASALTRFIVRHLVSSLLLIGFLLALADGQRRTFHDRFAGSVVVGREREVWTPED